MLFRPLAAALLSVASGATVVARADAVSSLVADNTTLTINVPIDIVGASAELVAKWRASIDHVWNTGNDGRPFTVCGRTLRFNPRFTPQVSAEPSRSSHLVVVRQVKDGDQFVSTVWHALGTSPAYSSRTGYWGSNIDGVTAAHEFGHLLGLLDEYIEGDASAHGPRGLGERPIPDTARYSDAWFSLMAGDRGVVLPRHIDEILRMHGAALTCGTKN